MNSEPSFRELAECRLLCLKIKRHLSNGGKTPCPEFDEWLKIEFDTHSIPPDHLIKELAEATGFDPSTATVQ